MEKESKTTEQELYEQELANNPVKVIEKLDRRPGEVDFSQLSDGDYRQLMTRYLNDVCSINKSSLQIIADLYVIVEFIAEKLGIDVKAKKMELAKKIKKQMDQDIENAKEQLKSQVKA